MKLHKLKDTDLSVSEICYGVMHFGTLAQDKGMFDLYSLYREEGGNFFDTAHGYACWMPNGLGASERGLGECLRKFGDRDKVVVTTKGGCPASGTIYPRPDNCLCPEVIAGDITDSLNRLQIDSLDVFILHRDDTRQPVSEIMETLNAEIRRGRTRFIGASNWTVDRLVAANNYAAEKKLQGFIISSPQWNLAYPNHAPLGWSGPDPTAHYLTDEEIDWHREHKLPIMPFTASAYGYFAGSGSVNAQSFDNPTSRQRRERARQLAGELNCTSNQIALAYLLAYDFPVFPILGTMSIEHLADSLAASEIRLSPEQRDWLRNG